MTNVNYFQIDRSKSKWALVVVLISLIVVGWIFVERLYDNMDVLILVVVCCIIGFIAVITQVNLHDKRYIAVTKSGDVYFPLVWRIKKLEPNTYLPTKQDEFLNSTYLFHITKKNIRAAYAANDIMDTSMDRSAEILVSTKKRDDKDRIIHSHVFRDTNIVCIEFKLPIKKAEYVDFGLFVVKYKKNTKYPDIEKIYISVKEPYKFVDELMKQ
jgi:hypothetical protein